MKTRSDLPATGHNVRLGVTESNIHGVGCFALSSIPSGTIIGEYCGERIDQEEAIRRNDKGSILHSDYVLEVEDNLFIDGAKWDGPIRFVNHSCDPNCRVYVHERRAYFVATKEISAGEEITMDYYLDEDVREPCICRSQLCRGYM